MPNRDRGRPPEDWIVWAVTLAWVLALAVLWTIFMMRGA
jgi:hypothetical protein